MKRILYAMTVSSLAVLSVFQVAYAEHSFDSCERIVTGGPGVPIEPEAEYRLPYTWAFEIEGTRHEILYDGHISNVTASVEDKSIQIDSDRNCLFVRLSTELISSSEDDQNIPFTVLVNGQTGDVEDVTLSTGERFLAIKIPTDDSKIEIIGTAIAPEFGPVTVITIGVIMAVALSFAVRFKKAQL